MTKKQLWARIEALETQARYLTMGLFVQDRTITRRVNPDALERVLAELEAEGYIVRPPIRKMSSARRGSISRARIHRCLSS